MLYRLEKDMTEVVLRTLPGKLGINGPYAYALEVPIGYRQADLSFLPLPSDRPELPNLSIFQRLTLKDLWELLVDSWDASSQTIAWSASSHQDSNDRNTRLEGLSDETMEYLSAVLAPSSQPLIFVELKLSKWKDALEQASYYLRGGGIACVVIDGDAGSDVPAGLFIQSGIGLFAALDDDVQTMIPTRRLDSSTGLQRTFYKLRVLHDLSNNGSGKWAIEHSH